MGTLLEILVVISLCYGITAVIATVSFYRRPDHGGAAENLPLSVLKPIHGYNDRLRDTLQSVCSQDYPDYQVIFGTESRDSRLHNVLEDLRRENRHCDIEVVLGDRTALQASNGKVRTLSQMLPKAKHSVYVISDSDMLVTPDYLKAIAGPFLDPKIGVVTCLYRSVHGVRLAGALEAFAININFLPSVMVARLLGDISFAFGATMAVHKSALEKIGGIESLKDYLADDYLLGNRVYHAGYKVFLSDYLVDSINHIQSFRDYFSHQLRWARTYRICRPYGYFFSFITHTVALSLLFLCIQPHLRGLLWVACALTVRFITVAGAACAGIHGREYWKYTWALPLFDLLQSVLWCLAFLGNTVSWNETRFHLRKDGTMSPIPEAGVQK